ncbi:hypothetical protein ATEIFO6365_0006053100 [Aspergillus terreus]|uniref:Aminoglycoside phosphotransferase domain-containing protein n=1 Tax=Aspergillus terreus TaxID=33178 RepID=A0A5M3YX67_ASPTE|nr:hypothetical protein ATETN484_0005052900 [Aspergillus terreus]GFF17194.1 hypothetical protein ATEIFO6365_0006053100 [Aspergillus terreus]
MRPKVVGTYSTCPDPRFRASHSLLDTERLALARTIHGDVVPACVAKETFGPSAALTVYVMEKVPGITYTEASLASLRCPAWQERTMADLARRFFASSWKNRLAGASYRAEYSFVDIQGSLDTLAQRLPPRFHRAIADIRGELPIIFALSYPLVLGHGDLCKMNILVDPEAGGITGIIDWAEAMVLPFGMSLWGVLSILGRMDSRGWHYHADASQLERLFWETFHDNAGQVDAGDKRAITVAERAGLLLRYGFTWENGLHERPVIESESSFGYLDAFLPRLQG